MQHLSEVRYNPPLHTVQCNCCNWKIPLYILDVCMWRMTDKVVIVFISGHQVKNKQRLWRFGGGFMLLQWQITWHLISCSSDDIILMALNEAEHLQTWGKHILDVESAAQDIIKTQTESKKKKWGQNCVRYVSCTTDNMNVNQFQVVCCIPERVHICSQTDLDDSCCRQCFPLSTYSKE